MKKPALIFIIVFSVSWAFESSFYLGAGRMSVLKEDKEYSYYGLNGEARFSFSLIPSCLIYLFEEIDAGFSLYTGGECIFGFLEFPFITKVVMQPEEFYIGWGAGFSFIYPISSASCFKNNYFDFVMKLEGGYLYKKKRYLSGYLKLTADLNRGLPTERVIIGIGISSFR